MLFTPVQKKLANGLQIAFLQDPHSAIAHAAIFVGAGSKDETAEQKGIAHLIEHLCFKGTAKKTNFQVLTCLEAVGGEINAYTTKEETCYHAIFSANYLYRALELLQDILFNSIFDAAEIIKEKTVISEEINSYEDQPYEKIYEDFESLLFANSSWEHSILGTKKSLKNIGQKDIFKFHQQYYQIDNMVLSIVAPFSWKKIEKMIDRLFAAIEPRASAGSIYALPNVSPFNKQIKKNISQTHAIWGCRAFPYFSENKIALSILNNVFGGSGLSSRLNLLIREKYGWAYHVESSYQAFMDTGIFYVYMATDPEHLEKCQQLLFREMNKIQQKGLSVSQLEKAKIQYLGQWQLACENKANLCQNMGKMLLNGDNLNHMLQHVDKVKRIKVNDLQTATQEIFDTHKLQSLFYIPNSKH